MGLTAQGTASGDELAGTNGQRKSVTSWGIQVRYCDRHGVGSRCGKPRKALLAAALGSMNHTLTELRSPVGTEDAGAHGNDG